MGLMRLIERGWRESLSLCNYIYLGTGYLLANLVGIVDAYDKGKRSDKYVGCTKTHEPC